MSSGDGLADESNDGYVVPAKVDLQDLQNQDADDESLAKYKAQLLGNATSEALFPDNPNCVVVESFSISAEGRDPMVFDPNKDDVSFVLKEGCKYNVGFKFYVQRDLVSGLRYLNSVYKFKVRVTKTKEVLGSYAPKAEIYDVKMPMEIAPSGMMARGNYNAKSSLIDDDGHVFVAFDYKFSIEKDWA